MRVVTVWAGLVTTQAVRTTRRTRFTGFFALAKRTGAALARRTRAGRDGGFSATCMAPPPMTAPPHVQAQSLARAIRTDIATPCSKLCGEPVNDSKASGSRFELCRPDAKKSLTRNGVNHDVARKWSPNAGLRRFRPNRRQTVRRGERALPSRCGDFVVNAFLRRRFAIIGGDRDSRPRERGGEAGMSRFRLSNR